LIITPSTALKPPLAASRAVLADEVAVVAEVATTASARGVARTTAYGNVRDLAGQMQAGRLRHLVLAMKQVRGMVRLAIFLDVAA